MLEVYYRYLPMYQLIQSPQRGEADTDPRHAPTGAPSPSVI